MKEIKTKRIMIEDNLTFRGKHIKVTDMTYQIKKAWKKFIKILFILVVISIFIISIFLFGRYTYYKEYYSRTWYLETAYLDNSHAYSVITYDENVKKEIIKYTRFYQYTGKDGILYYHQLKNNDTEGIKGEELLIYVSEENNAKTLSYQNFENENRVIIGLNLIIFIPYLVLSFVKITTLYIKRKRIIKETK